MTEDTKQFLIKFLVMGAVISVLYLAFSPYRNCLRDPDNSAEGFVTHRFCNATTSW